ncbi:unnamed protein product [Blepharisma stoltei]|uniref:Uncharacterized protein n=1 Tax=Blepharisma stoltei TaxID=1481888 RepID=A0AAU9I8T3_9CILI|nr:unnamed protein product [Blepharisma stoltei]
MSQDDPQNPEVCPSFAKILNYLSFEFEDFLLQIQHFAEELTFLVSLAENDIAFCTDSQDIINQSKATLAKVDHCEVKTSKILDIFSVLTREIDNQIEKSLKHIKNCQTEISQIYFFLNDFISEESANLIGAVKDMISETRVNFDNFNWKEDISAEENCYSKKIPKITFSHSINSHECKVPQQLGQIHLNLQMTEAKIYKKNPNLIAEVFNYNAQILANANNMQKVLLYLKIILENTEKHIKTINEQTYLKHEAYSHKGNIHPYMKDKIYDEDKYSSFLAELTENYNRFSEELSKLNSYIQNFGNQFGISQMSLIPVKDLLSYAIGKRTILDKLKLIYNNASKISDLMRILSEQNENTQVIKGIIKDSKLNQLRDSDSLNDDNLHRFSILRRTSTIVSQTLHGRMHNNILYALFHMKASILKKIQIHSLVVELSNTRTQLVISMKKFIKKKGIDAKAWEKKLKILTIKKFNFDGIENKIKHSEGINVAGYHSYNSSWDLQCINEDESLQKPCKNNSIGSQSHSSDSISSSSIYAESLLSDTENNRDKSSTQPFDKNKMNYKPLGKNQIDSETLDHLVNLLNKEVKKIHSNGVGGWKKRLKDLNNVESKNDFVPATKMHLLQRVSQANLVKERPSKLLTMRRSTTPEIPHFIQLQAQFTARESIVSTTPQPTCLPHFLEEETPSRIRRITKPNKPPPLVLRNNKFSAQEVIRKIKKTLYGEKLSADILEKKKSEENNLNRCFETQNKPNSNMKKGMRFYNCADASVKRRILQIDRDRSLSPIDKLQTMRGEFEHNKTKSPISQRRKISLMKIKGKDSYLMSMT